MRTVKIMDLITQSIQRTKWILVDPFDVKKWLKLIWIGMLAGALMGGGFPGGYFRLPGNAPESKPEATQAAPDITSDKEDHVVVLKKPKSFKDEVKDAYLKGLNRISGQTNANKMVIFGAVLLIPIGLQLLIMWVHARFRFVWLHAVIHNKTDIALPFRSYRKQGDSFFKLSLVVFVILLVLVGVFVWWMISLTAELVSVKMSFSLGVNLFRGLVGIVSVFIAALIFFNIWYVFVEHFVMPMMIQNDSTYLPAWDKFSDLYKEMRREFWVFLVVMMAMGFVCSMIEGVITFVLIIAGIILAAVIYGIGFLIFFVLLKSKFVFIGFAVGAGIPLVFALIVMMFAVMVPFAVFFRNFSLYFLSSLNAGYSPLQLDRFKGEA